MARDGHGRKVYRNYRRTNSQPQIADCGNGFDGYRIDKDLRRECQANAHLFVDARETAAERDRLKAENAELLAALKAIHDRLKPFVVTYQHQSEKDALRWAKEAIAKAEGKECTTPK